MKKIYNVFEYKSKKEIFHSLKNEFHDSEIIDSFKKIQSIMENYHSLMKQKTATIYSYKIRKSKFEKEIANVRHLCLNITDQCNFRCKYCVFSGNYKNYPSHKNDNMSFEIAKSSIDYFFTLVNSSKRTIRYGNTSVGFYGGEPLLKFDLIQKSLDYAKSIDTKEKLEFTITTNGSILDDKIINFLISNNFFVLISLDGPRIEHNKFRVYKNGRGTFDRVWKNIEKIKNKNETYFKEKVGFSLVYCEAHNLLKIGEFFLNNFNDKTTLRAAKVLEKNTTFYDNLEKHEKFDQNLKTLKYLYEKSLSEGKMPSFFLQEMFSLAFFRLNYRSYINLKEKILFNEEAPKISSTCFPGGLKLFVDPKGDFHICERMNRHLPIGSYEKGIEYEKVIEIKKNYYNEIERECHTCEAIHICPACFTLFCENGNFKKQQHICKRIREELPIKLKFYVSILEKNPNAFKHLSQIN